VSADITISKGGAGSVSARSLAALPTTDLEA